MGVLYDIKVSIENRIKADRLDGSEIRGQIGLRTGRLLALISPGTPDDPVVVAKLKQAAKDLLSISL